MSYVSREKKCKKISLISFRKCMKKRRKSTTDKPSLKQCCNIGIRKYRNCMRDKKGLSGYL